VLTVQLQRVSICIATDGTVQGSDAVGQWLRLVVGISLTLT